MNIDPSVINKLVVAYCVALVEFLILLYLLVRHIRTKRAKRQPPT